MHLLKWSVIRSTGILLQDRKILIVIRPPTSPAEKAFYRCLFAGMYGETEHFNIPPKRDVDFSPLL
jgi:hypothetical protein